MITSQRAWLSLVLALAINGCSPGTNPGDAAPSGTDAADAMDATSSCTGFINCVEGAAGRACSDVSRPAPCVGGALMCPAGTVDFALCGCQVRPPPNGVPLMIGDMCPAVDAGADVVSNDVADNDVSMSTDVANTDAPMSTDVANTDAASVDVPRADVTCSGPMPTDGCVSGGGSVPCGDAITEAICIAGIWGCPEGMVRVSQCTCIGRPPGRDCVCTAMGWSCGGDAG